MRFLLFSLLSLLTFLGHAQESIVATTVVEKDDAPVIAQTAPATVEVGRHVMGNIDAGSMIVSLLAVLVAIVIIAWLLKKLQVGGTSVNGLKVVTSLNLGSKERLVVVQVGKKQLLLGVTGQQINILDTLAEPIEVKSGVPIELSQTLARFSRNSANKANSEKYS
ncbi:flagellar biosynthetic protein FliO [Colwellia sp. BRX9-1]|uniref:flagellar biosynthetic protein FliO n=1 Tax=Colwellia sp. BRX9-1 TaxID=2759830 RepID=UPI0015F69E72|nr:flagellar biosynthetic protein FliO [Colwellia sp. BRX9-1]MBA6350906.1 flagellar biosynthetic protein FliO [Colwellia sp. BRX9-1]